MMWNKQKSWDKVKEQLMAYADDNIESYTITTTNNTSGNIPYHTGGWSQHHPKDYYYPYTTTSDSITNDTIQWNPAVSQAEFMELKQTVDRLMSLIVSIVQEDCASENECGECIPCKARLAFTNEYLRTARALAGDD